MGQEMIDLNMGSSDQGPQIVCSGDMVLERLGGIPDFLPQYAILYTTCATLLMLATSGVVLKISRWTQLKQLKFIENRIITGIADSWELRSQTASKALTEPEAVQIGSSDELVQI